MNRITNFFPPAEETSTEKKLRDALSNCLSNDAKRIENYSRIISKKILIKKE